MSARRMRGRGGLLLAAAPTSGRRASARVAPLELPCFRPRRGAPARGGLR